MDKNYISNFSFTLTQLTAFALRKKKDIKNVVHPLHHPLVDPAIRSGI